MCIDLVARRHLGSIRHQTALGYSSALGGLWSDTARKPEPQTILFFEY